VGFEQASAAASRQWRERDIDRVPAHAVIADRVQIGRCVDLGAVEAGVAGNHPGGAADLARDRCRIVRGREKRRDAALAQEPDSGGWIG